MKQKGLNKASVKNLIFSNMNSDLNLTFKLRGVLLNKSFYVKGSQHNSKTGKYEEFNLKDIEKKFNSAFDGVSKTSTFNIYDFRISYWLNVLEIEVEEIPALTNK